MPGSSVYIMEGNGFLDDYNDLMGSFIMDSFGLDLMDLLPSIQYCATFFNMVFTFESPLLDESDKLDEIQL